jgi:iron(III) transport system ATP-binding protein
VSMLMVRDLAKSYGAVPVLQGLELNVPDGRLGAVLGPSGCGKTTLLRVLAGFERADRGEVTVGDRPLSAAGVHVAPERRRVGIVPQEGALFPHLCVADNVGFALSRGEVGERVAELLALVGLPGHERRMPHELSGGQQQRVALARALAPRPDLILLDEPFNALDVGLRAAVREEVRQVLREQGTTAVLVTHDQEEALATADVVALLREGRIVQSGRPREVYERPCDMSAARFLGEIVELEGRLRDGRVHCALGAVQPHPADAQPLAGATGTVVLRPEQLTIDPQGPIRAEVKDTRFLGHDTVVQLALSESAVEISARLHAYPGPQVGSTIQMRVAGTVSFFPAAA